MSKTENEFDKKQPPANVFIEGDARRIFGHLLTFYACGKIKEVS